tara:strand:+ start:453 stop:662 length:210 start_codon:yes stop_codon:yes gene_type:complete
MKVTLNGKSHEFEANSGDLTITAFVSGLDLGNQPVLVELNGEAVLAREFDTHYLSDGDTIEVIRMVAGG